MTVHAPASVPVAVKSGKLSTDLNVSFSIAGDTPTIRIVGSADLADLDVTDKANAPLVKAARLHVKIADAEPLRSVYKLDEITLTNPDVRFARDVSGVLNVQKLAGSPSPEASKPAAETAPPKDEKEAAPAARLVDQTCGHPTAVTSASTIS